MEMLIMQLGFNSVVQATPNISEAPLCSSTKKEKVRNLSKGIEHIQKYRNDSRFPLSQKALEKNYAFEAATRLMIAQLFIDMCQYDNATIHLEAVKDMKGSFDNSVTDFIVANKLLEKIEKLKESILTSES